MGTSKLMTPFFCGNTFNRDGRKIRAILEREISDGTQTYRLWRSAGKPDLKHPCSESDKYILFVEINGYLATLHMTDFDLIDTCGFDLAAKKLYGGKENRGKWIDQLRESGGNDAVEAAVEKERMEIEQYGSDPARQTEYIRNLLNGHVSAYIKAKENGGQSFPDFIGALVMNDLAHCLELSAVYKAKQQAEDAAWREEVAKEEKAYCAALNQEVEQAVSAAIQIIREGGILKNGPVTFHHSCYHSSTYSIVNHLMRKYQIDVPLRTQGWINYKLVSATIKDGKCEHLQFSRSKNGQCSQNFFECMNALIQAVMAETL